MTTPQPNDKPRPKLASGRFEAWYPEKGYGFLRTEDGRKVFVHHTTICQHLAVTQGRMIAAMLGFYARADVPVGTVAYVFVEDAERGLRSVATGCEGCYRRGNEEGMREAAKVTLMNELKRVFGDGYRFMVNDMPWFYRPGMPKQAINDALAQGIKEAFQAIVDGDSDDEIKSRFESAVRAAWAAEHSVDQHVAAKTADRVG